MTTEPVAPPTAHDPRLSTSWQGAEPGYRDGSTAERPVGAGARTPAEVSDRIADVPLGPRVGLGWYGGLGVASVLMLVLTWSIVYVLAVGTGVWGLNRPVMWAFAIINFVWWIGIGHAGTLISAILYLLHQEWRTSINRVAEAMTLFAVACAGLFPLIHLGRPWFFYWLVPYPATTGVWPQFRSPLIWDFFAVSTYLTVSLLFWYAGLVPDVATLRDRSRGRVGKLCYGVLALGWRNSARHWHKYRQAYVILAALATPLVVSVHTTVSFDFAVAIVPGWHSTVFPPYFVAGAIFCGFAMVLVITIPMRAAYGVRDMITDYHLDVMGRVMLAAGLCVAYGYTMDWWTAWIEHEPNDSYIYSGDFAGPYAAEYWLLVTCNVLAPQALWFRAVRRSAALLFVVALFVNVGMWLERFVIIALSLRRGRLPSSREMYYPTAWDWSLYLGTFGLFVGLLFLFFRVLPMISMAEMRELTHKVREEAA